MDDLSVWRVLGELWALVQRLLDPLISLIGAVPWAFGDWTVFTALALPFAVSLVRRRKDGLAGSPFRLALLGFALGGIIEYFQPNLERCLAGTGCF